MVLLEDDDDVFKRTFGDGDARAGPRRHNRFWTRLALRRFNWLGLRLLNGLALRRTTMSLLD